MKQVRKVDLINELVEKYGYDKDDLKFDSDGKLYTNAKLQDLIKSEEEDAKQLEKDSTRKVAKKSKIKSDDRIVIMSGIDSVSYYSTRTNTKWAFSHFGQQDTMEYSELITMNNNHPVYLKEGYIIVLDKDVQEELKLTELYENIITPDNIDSVFKMEREDLENFVNALPEGQKQTLVSKASELYEKDKIEKVSTVKFFQDKFNFNFDDNAPLNDIVAKAETTGINNIIIVDKN